MNTNVVPGPSPSTRKTTSLEGFAARTPPAQPVGFGALLAALVSLVIKPAAVDPEAAATATTEGGEPGAEGGEPGAKGVSAAGIAYPGIPGLAGAGGVAPTPGVSGAPAEGVPAMAANAKAAAGTDNTGGGRDAASPRNAAAGNGNAARENAALPETAVSQDPANATPEPAHSRAARPRHAAEAKEGDREAAATLTSPATPATLASPASPATPVASAVPTFQGPGVARGGKADAKPADTGGTMPETARTTRAAGWPSTERESVGRSTRRAAGGEGAVHGHREADAVLRPVSGPVPGRDGSSARQSAGSPAGGTTAGFHEGRAAGNGTMADGRAEAGVRLHAARQVVTGLSANGVSSGDASQPQDIPPTPPMPHSVAHDGAAVPRPPATQHGATAYAAVQAGADGTQDGNDARTDAHPRDRGTDGGDGARAEMSTARGAEAPAFGAARTGSRSFAQGPMAPGRTDAAPSMQAHHVDRIAHVQDAQAARPPHQVTLHVEDADGVTSRVKVALRGVRVGAQIDTAVAAAGELRARTGELRRALDRHGLRADGVQIRPIASDPVPAAVNDRHAGAAGGHAQGRDDGRAPSHGRPDGQRRHQDRRPGEGRDQKEAS